MDQIRNIVAAVGVFPQDESVLLRASEIAHAHGARLTVVNIIDTLTGFNFVSADLMRIQQQMRLDAHKSVNEAVAKLVVGVADIDIRIEFGSPSMRLIELADEIKADLVIMRAHQRDSIRKKIIGSTTDRVIRVGRIPILVVKRSVEQAYQSVVVSIDNSDGFAGVLPFVERLCPLAKLSLIHVVQISNELQAAMMKAGVGNSIETHRDASIRNANSVLKKILETLEYRSTRTTTRVISGDPATSLVRATWNPNVDLIVLAPNSTGVIRRALLGSVAQRVLRDAACDILICRTTD